MWYEGFSNSTSAASKAVITASVSLLYSASRDVGAHELLGCRTTLRCVRKPFSKVHATSSGSVAQDCSLIVALIEIGIRLALSWAILLFMIFQLPFREL